MKTSFLMLAAGLFLAASSIRAEEGLLQPLVRNPFLPPVALAVKPPRPEVDTLAIEKQAVSLRLRATMVSPSASVANINGVMVRKGGIIDGFTLVDVQEQKVVLEKNGQAVTRAFEKRASSGGGK